MQFHYKPDEHLTSPPAPGPGLHANPEEVLVKDSRAGLTPADMVERKLLELGHSTMSAGLRTSIRNG